MLFNNASWNLDNYYLKWNLKKNTNFIQLDNAQCQVNDTSLNNIEQIKDLNIPFEKYPKEMHIYSTRLEYIENYIK